MLVRSINVGYAFTIPPLPPPPPKIQARALLAAPDGDGQASSSSTTYNQAVDQLIAYRALLEEYDAVDYPAAVLTSSLALPSPSDDAAARRRRRLLRDGRYVDGLVGVRGFKWLVLVTDAPYILLPMRRGLRPRD